MIVSLLMVTLLVTISVSSLLLKVPVVNDHIVPDDDAVAVIILTVIEDCFDCSRQ